MKKIRRIFIWIIIFVVFSFLGLEIFIATKGKQIAVQRLTEKFHRPVRISEAHWVFPLGVAFKKIDIEGLLRAKQAKAFFNVSNFQKNRLDINCLTAREGEAEVEYNDMKISLKEIQGEIKNFIYPFESVKTQVDITARIEGEKFPFSGGEASAQGWVDLKNLNMDGHVIVKASSGKEMLVVDLKAKNNDAAVSGKVNMLGLMAQGLATQKKEDPIQGLISGALGSEGLNMMANFSFQTKMNDFQLENVSFSGKFRQY